MSNTRPFTLPPDVRDRLARRSERVGECLLWRGAQSGTGYGRIGWADDGYRRSLPVHRVAFAAYVGPIPSSLHIHHACGERLCIEPSHLHAVTQRAHNNGHTRTYCRRGHLLAETAVPNAGARTCGVCRRERRAERLAAICG